MPLLGFYFAPRFIRESKGQTERHSETSLGKEKERNHTPGERLGGQGRVWEKTVLSQAPVLGRRIKSEVLRVVEKMKLWSQLTDSFYLSLI